MPATIFSQQALSKLVADTVPETRGNAIVGTVDKDGVSVVVVMSKDVHWTIEGVIRRDWGGDISTGAKVIYSW